VSAKSAVYSGTVRHRRFAPRAHAFSYDVTLFLVDLAEVEKLFAAPFLFSWRAPALWSFRRKDYFGDPARPLADCVRDHVLAKTGKRPEGPIRLLTQICCAGFCFNPVSFYYCYDAADAKVEFIMAEITNTPWRERHAYVLECAGRAANESFSFPKTFHVSPFMSMDLQYQWLFSPPAEKLLVHMENHDKAGRFFDATMTLRRADWTPFNVAAALARHPLMTFKTIAAIYFQSLKLRLKRTPFYPNPRTLRGDAS